MSLKDLSDHSNVQRELLVLANRSARQFRNFQFVKILVVQRHPGNVHLCRILIIYDKALPRPYEDSHNPCFCDVGMISNSSGRA
jgi:hypothetical protein